MFVKDVKEGDLWYFPSGLPHSIQGLGPDGCEFLLVFDDGNFSEEETFLLSDWMAHIPVEALEKNFGFPPSSFNSIPQDPLYSHYYASISLSNWLAETPPELVEAHTGLSRDLSKIPKKQVVIVP